MIFGRQRQNACSIYLISSAIANTIYITFYGFIQMFPYDYHRETISAIALCKIIGYIPSVLGQVAKTMIVLACIDRFMVTSDSATFRTFSTPKRAKWFIVFFISFWSLVAIHIPVMLVIIDGQCGISANLYSTILSVYVLIFVALIPSGTISVFGFLTYHNMRKMRTRIQPVAHDRNGVNIGIPRRDRNLLVIVISEIFFYIITTAPFCLIELETMISQHTITNKSVQYLQIESFILTIAYLLLYTNSSGSFYTYLMSSKQFRRDFAKIFRSCYQKLRRQPLFPHVQRVHE